MTPHENRIEDFNFSSVQKELICHKNIGGHNPPCKVCLREVIKIYSYLKWASTFRVSSSEFLEANLIPE